MKNNEDNSQSRPERMARIGCCGFAAPRKQYFKEFPVVEVQQTFYNLPMLETAGRWRSEAPDAFEYTAKAWQLITHEPTSPTYRRLRMNIDKSKRSHYGSFKPTDEVMRAWQNFLEFARVLGAKNILFQCPASFRPTPENKANISKFFSSIDRSEITCIWEPRGDWHQEEIREICLKHSLIHCFDPLTAKGTVQRGTDRRGLPREPRTAGSKSVNSESSTSKEAGSIRYFRLHGISGYRYHYTDSDLQALQDILLPHFSTYLMFNNISMFQDAKRLKNLLAYRDRA